ncbi:MAG: 50S ribosomal protein L23 [uncultured bacterium]|nr:MAG: 50S ribosomal protein L23 [uncultured bacterium]HLD44950.1 50S ribosomal protein L23 [bacterium]
MNLYDVIKQPVVTEKSSFLKESGDVYVFEVDKKATKIDIKKSIEKLFSVKVKAVKTLVQRGRAKRFGKGHGQTKSWKKAVVTLKEGKIEVFEGV